MDKLGVNVNNSKVYKSNMRFNFILRWAINLKLDRSEFESQFSPY